MKQNSGGIYMKRVYLFCNAGMSTSLVASKMQEVANQKVKNRGRSYV